MAVLTCTWPRAALAALASLFLLACAQAHHTGGAAVADPHVATADDRLETAAAECASRGYTYVARTGPRTAYCLHINPDHEPEAISVEEALNHQR